MVSPLLMFSRMNVRHLRRIGSLSLLFTLVHCGPPMASGPDGGTSTTGTRIGAAGGTVRTAFGAELTVPAGALSADTNLSIELANDDTPLPNGAVRIGPQFRITPEGARFATPARLELPLDPDDRERLGSAPEDVKVWVRTAEGWRLTAPVATSPVSVTIEVDGAILGAAGVRVAMRLPACGGTDQPACVATTAQRPIGMVEEPPSVCSAGFCSQVFVEPATELPFPSSLRIRSPRMVTVQDGKVYWMSAGLRANRRSLHGGPITIANDTSLLASMGVGFEAAFRQGANIAVDREGNAWSGEFRYSFTTSLVEKALLPASFDPKTSGAPPAVVTPAVSFMQHARAADGSIHGYRRVAIYTRTGIGNSDVTSIQDIGMERWSINPDRSVSGPTIVSFGLGYVGPFTSTGALAPVVVNDRAAPNSEWLMGANVNLGALGLFPPLLGARVARLDGSGALQASLEVPLQAGGLVQASTSPTGLCEGSSSACFPSGDSSISVRNNEALAPTLPAIQSSNSVQRLDGSTNPMTRSTIMLPRSIDPIVDVVHDSQTGMWLFTRLNSANRNQLWHFNRTTMVLTPISIGDVIPWGIASDGEDGVIVTIGTGVNPPSGLMRVRRFVGT